MDAFAIWMTCVMIVMVLVSGVALLGYKRKYGGKKEDE
jgi:hypothetical protein